MQDINASCKTKIYVELYIKAFQTHGMATRLLQNMRVIKKWLSKINVNEKNCEGFSCFYYFLNHNYYFQSSQFLEALYIFLKNGADINDVYSRGETPFHLLMRLHSKLLIENVDLLNNLIKNAKDVTAKDQDGYNPFYWFLCGGNYADSSKFLQALTVFLKSGADINDVYPGKETAFMLLIQRHTFALLQNVSLLNNLIEKVKDVNMKNNCGHSSFYWFLYYIHSNTDQFFETFTVFLKNGADINDVYTKNETAFQLLIRRNSSALLHNVDFLNNLIVKVKDVNAKDEDGVSSFFWFLCGSYKEPSQFLKALSIFLKSGADIRDEYPIKQTALHVLLQYNSAALLENMGLLNDLIANVKDVNAKDGYGFSSFYWFLNKSYKGSSEFLKALSIFLKNGADINAVYPEKETAFILIMKWHFVALFQNTDFLNDLIKKVNDVNAKDEDGNSLFFWFLRNPSLRNSPRFLDALSIFLKNGADLNDVDSRKNTAMHLLIQGQFAAFLNNIDFLSDLLSKVKNMDATDQSDKTSFHYLIEKRTLELMEVRRVFSVFLSNGAGFYVILLLIQNGYSFVFEETYNIVKPLSPNNFCSPCCAVAMMICSCNHQKISGVKMLLQYEIVRNSDDIVCLEHKNKLFSKLFGKNCSDLELSFWKNQFEACVSEVLRMKGDKVVYCYTFYDYVARLFNPIEEYPPPWHLFLKKVEEYPYCQDIVAASIVRPDLSNQDMNLSLRSNEKIVLNKDCCIILIKYLSDKDLKNILMPSISTAANTSNEIHCYDKNMKRKLSDKTILSCKRFSK